MASPYTDVYEYFLSKISDYSFLSLSDEDIEEELLPFLRTAISRFDVCKQDLTLRDDQMGAFEVDLTDMELEILSSLMLVAYLKPKVVSSDTFKLAMSDADYKIYSQANHIKEMLSLYKEMRTEVDKLITKYTYKRINLDDLT